MTISSRSSSHASMNRNDDPLLPFGTSGTKFDKPSMKMRVRSVLSRNIVRRVLIWAVASILLVSIVLYSKKPVSLYDVATHHQGDAKSPGDGDKSAAAGVGNTNSNSLNVVVSEDDADSDLGDDGEPLSPEDKEAKKQYQDDLKKMPWLRFKHLDGYFNGLKTLVPKVDHISEYPNVDVQAPLPPPPMSTEIPKPRPYEPYQFEGEVATCYLDSNRTIPAPAIYAYDGLPQNYPDPVLGSYDILGMRDDICFDRFGRYGPYGLGYSKSAGGSGVGEDTESQGNEFVWQTTGQIDYTGMNWQAAQERCLEDNQARFKQIDPETGELEKSDKKMGRTALVMRSYTGFKWTEHEILNFRALITELSLKSSGEYDVHMLLHVRDTDIPVWSDDVTVQRLLDANVPPEFHGIVTLWSEPQMRLFYPGKFGETFSNPSGRDIHGVYRSGHFPLQIFAMQHPEYEHFWNWEMDMRVVGSYYELFDRAGKWAATEPRPLIWERAARYYIPSYHGSWEEFAKIVQQDTVRSGLSSPFGPLKFPGRKSLRFEAKGQSVMPENCGAHSDRSMCGVGEAADLITMNPIFDTDQSGWFFGLDATGYASTPPPRRASIITASRLSRRLLMAMHEEVWRHHHTMFTEMFPASVAFHHGFKATNAPHPIYLDRAWDPIGSAPDAAFNGGRDHSTSGHGSPFDIANEHNHAGSSWYFNSEFSGMIWRRWLGYAQKDGRGKFGGRHNEGSERGGKEEEEGASSSGRLCLRSMLLHPIKHEHPKDPR
ncbi:uncharacterized protein F5Z01DRAFT_243753 [Emericellopsis atlantica]|uniref:Major facilitator superfamily transporter n=1 Tax=Emericellopsis atlantica TaxID=2614577 RepID=A0A9P7ZI47_9HYPO|nr:uncharacterized protein F5Z01DRAFT_243753 [Emericellopsis atlantica]KAG9251990.1 hypothetical protein F5Z01DRAFT_243753 [Emericellopsis atlantica]